MKTFMLLVYKYLPFLIAFANDSSKTDTGVKTPQVITNLLAWVGGIGCAIVAGFLIVALVKEGIQLAKGSGSTSIWGILGKALFLIFIIGMIFMSINYTELGKKAKNIGDTSIDTIETEINNSILTQ